jgi:hypothetical protein
LQVLLVVDLQLGNEKRQKLFFFLFAISKCLLILIN